MAKPITTAKGGGAGFLFTQLKNTDQATVPAGSFIKLASGGFTIGTDGAGVDGFTNEDIAAATVGKVVLLNPGGECWVDLANGFNPDMGDAVYVATSTTVDAGAQGNAVAGYVTYKNPASGARAIVFLQGTKFNGATHA